MEEAEIGARLREINEKECEDPLPDGEVQAIAQSAPGIRRGVYPRVESMRTTLYTTYRSMSMAG